MENEVLISFVLPAYKAKFLKQAIDSILSQTYSHIELIIVDDCSPENLFSIVDKYKDYRIRYFKNDKNIGGTNLVDQWNHCIKYARGAYLILAADDDVYDNQFVEKCLLLANHNPRVDVVRARIKYIDEENNITEIDGTLPTYTSKHEFLYHWLYGNLRVCIGNYMFKTSTILQKKFIDFPSAFCSDIASILNLAENGVANTSEILFSFRMSTIHLSSSTIQLDKKLKANTLFFKWLLALNYEKPQNDLEQFYYYRNRPEIIKSKCAYDYYNQVYKYYPISKMFNFDGFELLDSRQKSKMILRYFYHKIFRK